MPRLTSESGSFEPQWVSSVAAQFGQTMRRFSSRWSSRYAVDVIEDQRRSGDRARLAWPHARRPMLAALLEEALLEMSPGVGRVRDQDLGERPLGRSGLRVGGIRIEVIGRDPPEARVLLKCPPVAASASVAKISQGLSPATASGRSRLTEIGLRESWNRSWHEHMFVHRAGRNPGFRLRLPDSDPGWCSRLARLVLVQEGGFESSPRSSSATPPPCAAPSPCRPRCPARCAGPRGGAMPSTRIAFRPRPSFSRPSVEVTSWPQSSLTRSRR